MRDPVRAQGADIRYLTWELERMGRGMLEVSAQDEERPW